MEMKTKLTLYKWMWWTKGECVVEVLKTGHFPTTAMVRLPNDKETEIDITELEYTED
jgi:hypothetical protein